MATSSCNARMAIASSSDEMKQQEQFSVEEAQEWIDEMIDFKELAKEEHISDPDLVGGEGSSEIEKISLMRKMVTFLSVRQIQDKEETQADQCEYPEGYNKEVARMLVDHSTAAYCPNCGSVAPIMECGCPSEVDAAPGFVYVQRSYNEKYDASAFCGYDKAKKSIVASFRGTASLTNWKANLKFAKGAAAKSMGTTCNHPYPQGAKVHKGFYDTYSSVTLEIVSKVVHLTNEYPNFQVYVTGHSMGGAQATFCCADLVHTHGISSVIGYTFGQPQVFDAAGKKFFHDLPGLSFYRIVNGFDPVPLLPGHALGYHHVGRLLHFRSVNRVVERQVLKKSSYRSLEDYTQVASKHAKWATYIRFRIIDHLAYAERYGARRVLRGKVPPQDPWDDETKSYRVAVASTFTSFVQTSDQASIIFVHAPWCTHCRKFWPVFKRLAKEYQEDKRFQFIAIDGTVNDLPRAFVPLEKFPSIFLRRAETKANPELYEGRRIPEHIEKAMLGCLSKA